MGIYFANDIDRINKEYMPPLSSEIARYISYSKLESMFSTQALFFCNASNFEDMRVIFHWSFLTIGQVNQKKTIDY